MVMSHILLHQLFAFLNLAAIVVWMKLARKAVIIATSVVLTVTIGCKNWCSTKIEIEVDFNIEA